MSSRDAIEIIVRARIERGDRVLTCRSRQRGYCYLPGGHVEFGESAASALRRELLEEIGVECRIGELLVVHEASFRSEGRTHHEVNLVFRVELDINAEITSQEPQIEFEWVRSSELGLHDFRPAGIAGWLTRSPSQHISIFLSDIAPS